MRIDFKTILKYLRGELDSKEEHKIEREALDDPFLSDALEGFEQFESDDIEADLKDLKGKLDGHSSGIPWYSIAASISIVIIAGFSIWYFADSNQKQIAFENIPEKLEPKKTPDLIISDSLDQSKELKAYNPDNQDVSDDVFDEKISMVEEPEEPLSVMDKKMSNNENIAVSEDNMEMEIDISESIALNEEEPGIENKKRASEPAAAMGNYDSESAFIEPRRSEKVDNYLKLPDKEKPAERTISGKIIGESGEGLPGVNVVVKGTSEGVVTDVMGNFSITFDSLSSELMISSIGYISETVNLNMEHDHIKVMLSEDYNELSEVVVTGYSKSDSQTEPYIELPVPNGGYKALRDYVKDNQIFPDGVEEDKAVVKLQVTITPEGKIGDIEVLKTDGELFSREAIRLLKDGPEWNPGTVSGNPQEMEVKVRIKLRKDDN